MGSLKLMFSIGSNRISYKYLKSKLAAPSGFVRDSEMKVKEELNNRKRFYRKDPTNCFPPTCNDKKPLSS